MYLSATPGLQAAKGFKKGEGLWQPFTAARLLAGNVCTDRIGVLLILVCFSNCNDDYKSRTGDGRRAGASPPRQQSGQRRHSPSHKHT